MSGLHRPEVVAVVGATATGKSDLALDLARDVDADVVIALDPDAAAASQQ